MNHVFIKIAKERHQCKRRWDVEPKTWDNGLFVINFGFHVDPSNQYQNIMLFSVIFRICKIAIMRNNSPYTVGHWGKNDWKIYWQWKLSYCHTIYALHIQMIGHSLITFNNQSHVCERNSTWQRRQEAVDYVSQYQLTICICGCNINSAGVMVSIYLICITCYCQFQDIRECDIASYQGNSQKKMMHTNLVNIHANPYPAWKVLIWMQERCCTELFECANSTVGIIMW